MQSATCKSLFSEAQNFNKQEMKQHVNSIYDYKETYFHSCSLEIISNLSNSEMVKAT